MKRALETNTCTSTMETLPKKCQVYDQQDNKVTTNTNTNTNTNSSNTDTTTTTPLDEKKEVTPLSKNVVDTSAYEQLGDIYYIIDKDNKIVSCGPERDWDSFSAENGGKNLETTSVVGKDLFSFITGERTVQQYRKIHDLIWSGKKKRFIIKSMCDSPEMRRPLRTCISALSSPGDSLEDSKVEYLLYHHCIWDEQARPPVHHLNCPHFGHSSNDNIPILLMCSYCKDVMFPAGSTEGKWMPSAEYYAKCNNDPSLPKDVLLSHTVCDKCYSLVLADLDKE